MTVTDIKPELNDRGVRGFGMELALDLAGCDPEVLDSAAKLTEYVRKLIEKIGMTAYGDPIAANFGEGDLAGWTVIQLITTSNINLHASPADRSAHINVFSCKAFDPATATAFTLEFFGAAAYTRHLLDRTAPQIEV
jgi:S-adenosylmethionine/arginine decarboxylase-like enzyme